MAGINRINWISSQTCDESAKWFEITSQNKQTKKKLMEWKESEPLNGRRFGASLASTRADADFWTLPSLLSLLLLSLLSLLRQLTEANLGELRFVEPWLIQSTFVKLKRSSVLIWFVRLQFTEQKWSDSDLIHSINIYQIQIFGSWFD